MPICTSCARKFVSGDALRQHLASSGVEHPFCATCNRRFISQEALEGHMKARHPPTFDCTVCERQFGAVFALEDHYRGSAAHPNCVKCGQGFFDRARQLEHQKLAHPLVSCEPCGGILVYEENLSDHYFQVAVHPSCRECNAGFKGTAEYNEHVRTVHQEPTNITRSESMAGVEKSSAASTMQSPDSELPSNEMSQESGSERPDDFSRYRQTDMASCTAHSVSELSQSSWESQPPTSHSNRLPRPGRSVQALWTSKTNTQISRSIRTIDF